MSVVKSKRSKSRLEVIHNYYKLREQMTFVLFNDFGYSRKKAAARLNTGRVIQKINQKQLTRMRRKLKKLAHKLTADELTQLYNSWLRAHYKTMSKRQRANMDDLIKELTTKN